VRSGTAAPDVHTSAAIKQTLLAAKAPTWVAAGATRARVDKMLAALGIADAVAAKLVLAHSVDEAVELVTSGKSDLMIMLASEILPVAGAQYVGPLPDEFASYVSFAAAVSPASSARPAAERSIAALRAADTASVYASKGMELPR
jgi:molybdate transport system substrate-binding protein